MTWKKGGSTLERGPTMNVSPVLLLWKVLTVTRTHSQLTNFGHPALLSARSNPARRILPFSMAQLWRSRLTSTRTILLRDMFSNIRKFAVMWTSLKAGYLLGLFVISSNHEDFHHSLIFCQSLVHRSDGAHLYRH